MQSKMLINAIHREESRVAILEEGVLQELEVEFSGKGETKGNVYLGKVAMIQPSIHALFINYGGNRHGFLPFPEIHPSCYGRAEYDENGGEGERPTIEKNMKAGQEIMVQIVKEERDQKGAYLTTYISIAGRFLVLMPGSKKGGVSRKIDNEEERTKLKEIITSLKVPEDMGLIIRTAGMGRVRTDLKKDLSSLLRVWKGIKAKEKKQKAPSLIYQEGDIVLRMIRDYFSSSMEEILVDNAEVFKKAKDFMKVLMPRLHSRIKLHQDSVPLFSKYNLEEQIEAIYKNSVPLKSGGSIVIDPTEALVSIDVNSGRSKGEKNIENTAFQTNLEAAAEVARQLRLRDLGGLIVIDFIDMRHKNHIIEVEKTLKIGLKRDKARIGVAKISKFGLMEMSRQRIKSSLMERSFVSCPHCVGRGTIKSVESNALYLLRKIHSAAISDNIKEADLLLPLEVAEYLQNNKRSELLKIESDHSVNIIIRGQAGMPIDKYTMGLTKKLQPKEKAKESKPKNRPKTHESQENKEKKDKTINLDKSNPPQKTATKAQEAPKVEAPKEKQKKEDKTEKVATSESQHKTTSKESKTPAKPKRHGSEQNKTPSNTKKSHYQKAKGKNIKSQERPKEETPQPEKDKAQNPVNTDAPKEIKEKISPKDQEKNKVSEPDKQTPPSESKAKSPPERQPKQKRRNLNHSRKGKPVKGETTPIPNKETSNTSPKKEATPIETKKGDNEDDNLVDKVKPVIIEK